MKRSRSIKLVLISSTMVFLTACEKRPEESSPNHQISPALESPTSKSYASKEECEKVYGEGKCGVPPHEEGRSGGFMPLVAGYMLGSMMNRSSSGSVANKNSQDVKRGGFGGQAKRYFNAGG